ncbi:MAG TPA: PAS domain S-box protein [Candidatus Hydrogenedentes bacterium]|nr:PAS domain S-box protein [Candidatus Hydrogenedentota bacterium]
MRRDGNEPEKAEADQGASPATKYDLPPRVAWYVVISLSLVLSLHLLGRVGFYQGWYSFFIADTITFFSLLLLGIGTTFVLSVVYAVRPITFLAAIGIALILAGQIINVMDGISSFGGNVRPVVRPFHLVKEPLMSTGIVLFIGGLFWGVYETHRAKQRLQVEQETLRVQMEEKRKAFEELEQTRAQLENRVAERTAELMRINRQLEQEIAERRLIETALRDSEQRYRTVLEDQTEIISRFRPDGTFVFVNDVFCRFFNKTRNDLIEKPWQPLAHEDDRPIIEEQLGKMSPDNPVVVIENRVYAGTGEIRWMQFVNRGFFDKTGRLIETQSVGRDITERKQAEEALKESEESLRFMIESVDDVFWQLTPDLRAAYVSPADERQRGYKAEEVIGRSVLEFITPRSLASFKAQFSERLKLMEQGINPGSATYELEQIRKDGTLIWTETVSAPLFDSEGKLLGFQGITRDIDRRKKAEEALRESEAKYRELVESANSVIMRMDVNGNILFFNHFAQEFFGYTEEEIIGRNVIGTILRPEDSDGRAHEAMIKGIGEHPEQYLCNENENCRKNGDIVWISWTNRPIRDENGRIKEILCIGNDITERVKAQRLIIEQQLLMLNAARLSALGTMASGIAHEINNPMAIISVGAEQLERSLDDPRLSNEYRANVTKTIVRNVKRVQHIVQGLRNLSRDGSSDAFVRESVATIVTETLEVCMARCRDAGITLTVSPIPNELHIECRSAQLGQVLLNLINNAYDAVKELPEKWIRLDVEDEGTTIRFAITDSGHGLGRDLQEMAFVPFFTTKQTIGGIGLGLSISRRMVENHHGDLFLDAASSNTRFVVRLPKRQTVEA